MLKKDFSNSKKRRRNNRKRLPRKELKKRFLQNYIMKTELSKSKSLKTIQIFSHILINLIILIP
jgi:hypothetical protein